MKLAELKQIIDRVCASEYVQPEQVDVVIQVVRPGTVGGTPAVKVKTVNSGFDWDNGKLIITADSELREINRDEIKQLRKKIEELGAEYMHLTRLKAENHSLKEKLKHKRPE